MLMNKKYKIKKASTPLSITIVALFIVLTLFGSLYSFLMLKHNFVAKLDPNNLKELDNIYAKANILKFYLDDLAYQTDKNNPIDSFSILFDNFKKAYVLSSVNEGYIDFSDEFDQIDKQIDEEHIFSENNKLKFDFNIKMSSSSEDIVSLKYNYVYNAEL